MARHSQKSKIDDRNELLARGKHFEDQGKPRSAFRLYLAHANARHEYIEWTLGYCYHVGIGVRANRSKALCWYRRAFRHGESAASNNIGTIWRDAHNVRRAMMWFQRAVEMGFESSHLEIAKLYLMHGDTRGENARQAIPHLKRVLRSKQCIEPEKKEARRLLKQVAKLTPKAQEPKKK